LPITTVAIWHNVVTLCSATGARSRAKAWQRKARRITVHVKEREERLLHGGTIL